MLKMKILWLLTATVMLSANAFAGKIFGDIKFGDKPIPEGTKITVSAVIDTTKSKTPTPLADSTVTDKFGAYTVKVKGEGKCILTLRWEKQALTIEVASYANATRYDLILEKKEDKFTLKRK